MSGRAVVIGLARSGVGAANLLARDGYEVVVTDARAEGELKSYVERLHSGIGLALGGHPEGLFEGASLVVVSPGVPISSGVVRAARASGAEVMGELELAFRYAAGVPVYAVTGTNGKSTTVTMLHEILRRDGTASSLVGNIGTAMSEAVSGGLDGVEALVVEVSSFQLEGTSEFAPRVAAVLNVTPDHMDRYESLEAYCGAKALIAARQVQGDALVLNAEDPLCVDIARDIGRRRRGAGGPEVYYFSTEERVCGIYLEGGRVVLDVDGPVALYEVSGLRLKGAHNIENSMAAALMASLAGASNESIREALYGFEGLEHRCEFVRELGGVAFYNDSKGTNVAAAIKSIEGFASGVVLIAGGRDKDGDFRALAEACRGRVTAAVLIGEAAQKIAVALGGVAPSLAAGSMREAVAMARDAAGGRGVVLLSPACASFDMFENFEHRGREFKRLVGELA